MSKFTTRSIGRALRDNLAIVAGFGADHMPRFLSALDGWLADRHPMVSRAGYVLHVLENSSSGFALEVYEHGIRVAGYSVVREFRGPFGVYAAFADRGLKFLDLGTACFPIALPSPSGEQIELDDSPGVEFLPELVAQNERSNYERLVSASIDKPHFQLVYCRPPVKTLVMLARRGGTGVLEPYSSDRDIRKHVHERNQAVAHSRAYAYQLYLRDYVRKIAQVGDGKAATRARATGFAAGVSAAGGGDGFGV